MVDYEKWERYDCDDAEDIRMNSEISIREITNRKDTADLIFSEATASESAVSITKSEAGSSNAASSSDKALYHRSLELYLSVIQEILRYPQLTHLYVPCQLNSVTCYMKLQKWNQSIRICDSLLDANPCILTTIQLIRCHYFRACSYFEGSKNEISLRSALISSLAIQNLIETSTVEISEEDRSDSNLLHQKLTAFLQDQREGWKLVSEGKYLEAVKWFNDAVHSNPNSADFNDLDLLSSYFEGVGAAYDGMKDFSKSSFAYERAAELKSTTVTTQFDELDLSSKNFFQRLLLFSAHASLRDSLSTLLKGTMTNKMYQKEEYQTKIKRAGDLFQRLVTFTNRFSEPDLFTPTSSLYASLVWYGRACTHFLAPRYQPARDSYQKCISHISKSLSITSTPATCPQSLTLSSHNFLLYHALNLHKQLILRYDSAGTTQASTLLTQYLASLNATFAACLPLRFIDQTKDFISLHYSILFESYLWSLYITLVLKNNPETLRLCDEFYCWIEKYSDLISCFPKTEPLAIEGWVWIKKLTLTFLVVKTLVYNRLDCIDLEIQEQLYSQLFLHSLELSQHLANAPTPASVSPVTPTSAILPAIPEASLIVADFFTHVTWDCYEIFYLVTNYYFSISKLRTFQLDDHFLHNDNSEISHLTQRVVDLSSVSIKATARYLRLLHRHMVAIGEKYDPFEPEFDRLKNKEEVKRYCSLVISKIHDATMCYMQLHFWKGLCAPDRAQGQRFFECCHTACEDYDRTRKSSDYRKMGLIIEFMTNVLPKASPRDPLDDRFIWKNDYLNISGDCSFHLAYTYMRSGKIQYALEEIRKAIKCYNSIVLLDTSLRHIHLLSAQDLGKFNSKVDLEKTQKLRHAWGLVAVITCGMGDNPEAQEECHRAMRNIKYFTSGQDSYQELQRLQKVLEFNRARYQNNSTTSITSSTASSSSAPASPSSASAASPEPCPALMDSWNGAMEKIKQEDKDREVRLEQLRISDHALMAALEGRLIDWNLLFSNLILYCVTGFICYLFLAWLPYALFGKAVSHFLSRH